MTDAAASAPGHVLEGYLTRKECAAELGVADATLARWHTEGNAPPFVKIGKRILYRRAAVQAWLASRETGKAGR
jgi:excisionase family DNA binding protein